METCAAKVAKLSRDIRYTKPKCVLDLNTERRAVYQSLHLIDRVNKLHAIINSIIAI